MSLNYMNTRAPCGANNEGLHIIHHSDDGEIPAQRGEDEEEVIKENITADVMETTAELRGHLAGELGGRRTRAVPASTVEPSRARNTATKRKASPVRGSKEKQKRQTIVRIQEENDEEEEEKEEEVIVKSNSDDFP